MVRYVSIRHTGTKWFRRVLTDSFGLAPEDYRHRHVGDRSIVPLDPWIKEGHKVVVLQRDPVLYAISCVNRDREPSLHAIPILAGWVREHHHVIGFDINTADREAEVEKLAAFLGLPLVAPVDWTPVDVSPDAYGLRTEYLSTGIIPMCISEVMHWRDRDCRLITIPHTGTMFVQQMLQHDLGVGSSLHHVGWGSGAARIVESRKKCVVTLRDPVLAWASGIERDEPRNAEIARTGWDTVAPWDGLGNVHFIQVDGPPDARRNEVRKLCRFLNLPDLGGVPWTPVNTTKKIKIGIKADYLAGNPSPETIEVMAELRANEPVREFFAARGCSYPWMN